jgi:AI-2 transport protein TqsA
MAYVLLPYHNRLRKLVPSVVSVILIASCVAIFVGVIGFGVYASMGELQNDLPKLQKQALAMTDGASRWIAENAPWVKNALPERRSPADGRTDERVQRAIQAAIGTAAGVILEGLTAGLYLLFLLLGAGQLHDRVHGAYDSERAEKILAVFGRINSAIISYLRAKVVASLLLAFAAGVILAACGIRFALLWAVVTFLCNFIPYVGTVVAYSAPILFAAVSTNREWSFVSAAALLLTAHVLSAAVIEPTILGKAVGLSPIVILAALALWGSIWGLAGMLMAVPLTVVVLIVLKHFDAGRPVARLIEGS